MKISNFLSFLVMLITVATACGQKAEPKVSNGHTYYGEEFETKDVLDYDSFSTIMQDKDEAMVQVKAKVESVCQAKGCWMTLVSGDGNGTSTFVKFKDYGFFMPKDLGGKEVIVNGRAYKEITSVDELRHYAEDEGLSAEEVAKITEPKQELKFMADGVMMVE